MPAKFITAAEDGPPQFDPERLKAGPSPADLEAIPPADTATWEREAVVLAPLPDDIADELDRRAKRRRKSRQGSAPPSHP